MSHADAVKKYDRVHARSITMKFNKKYDADVLDKLDNVNNKQGYVKQLIRDDLAKEAETLQ